VAVFGRLKKTPKEQFSDEIAGVVRELLGVKPEVRPDFALAIPQAVGEPMIMFLTNVYAESLRLTGEARKGRLRTAVLAMTDTKKPTSWEEVAARLLPAVRAVSWAAVGAPAGVMRRPLVPFVQLCTAVDSLHAMTFVTDKDLRQWGVDRDVVERTAVANLTAMSVEIRQAGPVGLIVGPDGYVSSWLAVPAWLWRLVSDHFGPDTIALAPSRDQLRLVDTSDTDVVMGQIKEVLDGYMDEPRQLSPVPYLIRENRIEPWDPPPAHPAYGLVQRARRVLALVEYEYQKKVIQDLSDKAGEAVFVASYVLRERPDGTAWSIMAWTRQCENSLIPETDFVAAVDSDEPSNNFIVTWHDAVTIASDALTQEPGYDPPRWRYNGWASDATMAELRTKAVANPGATS
jgi:hypothetical protein